MVKKHFAWVVLSFPAIPPDQLLPITMKIMEWNRMSGWVMAPCVWLCWPLPFPTFPCLYRQEAGLTNDRVFENETIKWGNYSLPHFSEIDWIEKKEHALRNGSEAGLFSFLPT
jgi:hypothetical protein